MLINVQEWKADLKTDLENFKSFIAINGTSDYNFDYRLERFYFITAFIIRKLLESKKFSNKLRSKNYKFALFKLREDIKIDDSNYLYFSDNYKFNYDFLCGGASADIYGNLNINEIVNIIIHSYTLSVSCSSDELEGIFITTKQRNDRIYFLDFKTYEQVVNECIEDKWY